MLTFILHDICDITFCCSPLHPYKIHIAHILGKNLKILLAKNCPVTGCDHLTYKVTVLREVYASFSFCRIRFVKRFLIFGCISL